MTDLRKQELLDKIENLTQENAFLKATIKGLQKKVFGPRTERRPDSESMMPSLFNEAEVEADPKAKEPELETTVKEHKRKKKSQTTLKGLLESLPEDCIENIDIDLDENHKVCDVCGHELHPLGKFLVNTQVEIIPARLICKRYYQVSYECRECRKDGQSHIVKPVMPKPPIPIPLLLLLP